MGALKSAKDALVSGLALFGLIASATAVLRLIEAQSLMNFEGVIGFIIKLYQDFFYPIIDLTIGKILALFQINIDDATKDIFLLYCIIASSMIRLFYRRLNTVPLIEENRLEKREFPFAFGVAVFWPVAVPLAMVFATVDLHLSVKRMEERRPETRRSLAMRLMIYTSSVSTIALPILKEVMKVLAIAGVAIILAAADVL